MHKWLALYLFGFSSFSIAGPSVIYGKDDRKEVFEVSVAQKKWARATAGLLDLSKMNVIPGSDRYTLPHLKTLKQEMNLCSGEKYAEQIVVPTCSGFLIADDILVTAGHCFLARVPAEIACQTAAWVFDFSLNSKNSDPLKSLSMKNTYLCAEVIEAKLDKDNDYAVIRLDKRVLDREPLAYRQSGKISADAKLVAIGHPNGLPTKISNGAKILDNSGTNRFVTNLDTFERNSGSPVINEETGLVEGIVIEGKQDFLLKNAQDKSSCQVVNLCDENGLNCRAGDKDYSKGEVVTRVMSFAGAIRKAFAAH